MHTKKKQSETAPFVTFYSYKGGVGRSMAVLNVSALLASRGFRVLIIDFDLEAPGLSHLRDRDEDEPVVKKNAKKKPTVHRAEPGVVELLFDAKERGKDADLFAKSFSDIASKYTFHYEIPKKLKRHKGASLSIMPSGKMDEGYSRRLATLDLAGLYEQGLGKPLIHHFKQVLATSGLYDYVIVDSRTGHSDEAGICTRDLADHLMVVTGFNRQNISGTASFLANLRATLTEERRKSKLRPDVILSPVPIGEELLLSNREKCASREFEKKWGEPIKLDLFIPYHPMLALTEEAYVSTSTANYLGVAYERIEERLLSSLGHQPAALFGRIREAIMTGNGHQALVSFQRVVKIRRSFISASPTSNRMRGNWNYRFPLSHDEELLESLLKLPEASEILSLYADAHPSPYELLQIGRNLHQRKSPLAGEFDSVILRLEIPDPNSLGEYAAYLHNKQAAPLAVEAFYKAAIQADPKHAYSLGNYALFLNTIRKEPESAEIFYKRAIDADPKHIHNLRYYARFLREARGNLAAAEALYDRAIKADPENANILGDYALFLQNVGKNPEAIESLYKRAINADSKHANNLRNYADFLDTNRKNYEEAEVYYRRAVEADPQNFGGIRRFAGFLYSVRKKLDAADEFYRRAIQVAPKDALTRGDYGQFLIGNGKVTDGLGMLRSGWQFLDDKMNGNAAEFCYSIWLGSMLNDAPEETWEQVFKYQIQKGFSRHKWDFNAMLVQAKGKLTPKTYTYAKALADAFLDEAKVVKLEKFPRWRKVKPLDSYLVTPEGEITKA